MSLRVEAWVGMRPGNEDGSGGPEMRLCTGSCL